MVVVDFVQLLHQFLVLVPTVLGGSVKTRFFTVAAL